MSQTVLLPVEGKDKYKLGNLSEEQISVLKEDPNNIFKALAIGGGTFLAYETFQHLVNIPKEDWEKMLPDELEKFLSPFLQNHVDVEETIAENEIEDSSNGEMPDSEAESTIIADDKEDESHDENIPDDHHSIEIDDISDVLEDEGFDQETVDDFVDDADFTIDSEMMDYLHSDEILLDLNDSSAEEIIVNDEYISDEDIYIDDYSFETEPESDYTDDYTEDYEVSSDYVEDEDSDHDDFVEDLDENDSEDDDYNDDDIDIDDIPENL